MIQVDKISIFLLPAGIIEKHPDNTMRKRCYAK